jgi:catechol 2,3-dioxygenase-like lactoylglutathione lyase family enzyme
MDYYKIEGDIARQHYAFLVSEAEFDAAFARIGEAGITYWADPARSKPGEINRHDGGRGCYFEDPDGHLLEIITRPYGSGD